MIRLFHVSIPVSVLGLLVSESALIFACFIFACYQELDVDTQTFLRDDYGGARIAAVALTFIFGAYLTDLYTQIRVRSKIVLVARVMGIMGVALICEAMIGYVNVEWALPRSVVVTGTIAALVVLSAWRMLFSSALMPVMGSQRILFLGADPLALRISTQLLDHPELGMKTIGYLASEAVESTLPCLGNPRNLADVVGDTKPDRVVIAMAERRGRLPMDELLDLRFAGVYIEEAATLYEEAFGRVSIDEIRPSQLILSTALGPRRWTVRVQAVYSILLAAIGLLITAPILLIAAILVKLTSRGPVFYRQMRVGLRGSTFPVYKLRSMYQDAEAGTGAVWATPNDPRITPVGRVLRKSRLDELPQLFNVLRGEMSVVGPRPERPEFVRSLNQTIPYYRQRHCVKPGITGWAQINHQYGDTFEHTKTKLEYDLYYIKNLSPFLDAYIMFQTVKIMLLSRGAQ
jgi:sugar transferase (PEP-CTERM system associated)